GLTHNGNGPGPRLERTQVDIVMGGCVGVEHEYGAGNAGGGLCKHLQPLPHHLEIDEREAGDVSARMRQARNEALIDGIVDRRHYDRNGTCRLPQRPDHRSRLTDYHFGRQRHQFCCMGSYAGGVGTTKTYLDLDVAAVCPSQFLKSLFKRRHSRLSIPIVGYTHQQSDPPYALGLLRARRERPRGCHAAEQRDEPSPPQIEHQAAPALALPPVILSQRQPAAESPAYRAIASGAQMRNVNGGAAPPSISANLATSRR